MTLQTAELDDLEGVISALEANLKEDRRRVAPDVELTEALEDVAFFSQEMWQTVLLDLAYLFTPDTPFYTALGQFVAEAVVDPAFARFERAIDALTNIAERQGARSDDDLFAVDALLEVLASVLSFETQNGAEHFIPVCPSSGDVSVWSRIVQARLDRLGLLMHTGVGHPWGEEDEAALMRLSRSLRMPGAPLSAFDLSEAEKRAFIDLSGNADALIEQVRQRDPGGFLVAASAAFPGRRDAFYNRLKIRTDGYFSSAPLISFAPALRRVGHLENTRHEIAVPLHETADSAARDEANTLGLRLVQIKLWQRGYYEDLIDAQIGPNTVSAISEAVEIYGEQTMGDVLPDVLRRLGDGKIAISLHGLHTLVFSAEVAEAFTPEVAEAAAQAAETITARRAPADLEDIENAGLAPNLRADARDPERGFLGRIRSGVGRVFKTTGRVLRSGLNIIRRGVTKMVVVVDRMLSPLRDLMGLAFEDVDKVRFLLRWVLMTWRAFLLGKPLAIGTEGNGFVTVQFSLDRDARLLFINNPSDAVLSAFRGAANKLFRIMRLTFNTVAAILKVAVSLITWPGRVRLVFEVLGLIQNWVRNTDERATERDFALV